LNVDARDFVRGARPWDQFLIYCDHIANEVGGRFWAAQLKDPRYRKAIEEQIAKQRGSGSGRPPLEGHTEVVKALFMVANQVRMLTKAMTQSDIEFIEGPEGPADLITNEAKSRSFRLVDTALGHKEVS